MKVFIGTYVTESNAHVPNKALITNFDMCWNEDLIRKMKVKHIFDQYGVELIPGFYADAGGNGVVEKDAFEYIEKKFLQKVREHIHEMDGMYLFFHGASEVEEIGSACHHIVHEIRKIVGPYFPIAVSCDPHGNLTQQYADDCTIIRSFRETPHNDAQETKEHVCKLLCELLNDRQNIHCIYRKLPLILGGEQSLSYDEPVKSINVLMDEMEQDPAIRSVSWHPGYIRHDSDAAGCGIIVVPQKESDFPYCEKKADELAQFIWDRRHVFHYTGITAQPEEALRMVLEYPESPCFMSDSGDNTTAGAPGWNTFVLRQLLAVKDLKKKVLFASVCEPKSYKQLMDLEDGAITHLHFGVDSDELNKAVDLDVQIKFRAPIYGFLHRPHDQVYGHTITVHILGTNIDLMVGENRFPMCEMHQFEKCHINCMDYDLIIVKQGFIFPDMVEIGKLNVMSLTQGATLQDTAHIPFKRVMRPMYPIDNI